MVNGYSVGYQIRDFYIGIKKKDDRDRVGIVDEIDDSSTPYHIISDGTMEPEGGVRKML